jgi:hypothetical protein
MYTQEVDTEQSYLIALVKVELAAHKNLHAALI